MDEPGALKWLEIKGELDDTHLHHAIVMNIDLNLVPVFQDSLVRLVGSVNGLICLWQYGPIPKTLCSTPAHDAIHLHTKEYKVIRIFQGDFTASTTYPHISEAEVYTLGTGQWRRLGHVPYWISESMGRIQLFPSPRFEKLAGDIRYETLGILHGFLSLTDTSRYKFNIWVMKDYGIKKSWHKEVVITES
ncbi:hypothetical protein Tco_0511328 [Tanacetum coccineum]